MADSKIYAFVKKFANDLNVFATGQEESKVAKKMVRALKGVSDAMAETGITTVYESMDSDQVDGAIKYFSDIVDNLSQDGTDLAKRANKVKSYIDDDLLEEEEMPVARDSLVLWDSVKPRTGGQGARGVTRMNEADFEFAIYGYCAECDSVVKTGERTGRTDWNSLRHYCQEHAKEAHGSEGFSGTVRDAWREARKQFDDGANEVVVDGDTDTPAFDLRRAS